MKAFWIACALTLSAQAAGLPAEIAARNGQLVAEGDQLYFVFDLAARGSEALAVSAVEYAVSIEGKPLFAGVAQGFRLARDEGHSAPVAGFGELPRARAVRARLEGKLRFTWRVRGTLRGTLAGGAHIDIPFSSTEESLTPEELQGARRPAVARNSLLNY